MSTIYRVIADDGDIEQETKFDNFAEAKRAYDDALEKLQALHVALWATDENGERCLFWAEPGKAGR